MKVKIGNYPRWIGPYQIAEMLCFWAKPVKDEHGFERKPDWVFDFGTLLAGKENSSYLNRFCEWIHSKKKQKIKVHIDNYDIYSMDNTLSHIILPMLKKLKTLKMGAPYVDDEDLPEHLRYNETAIEGEISQPEDYDLHEERWNYILDCMIWSFEQINDLDNEDQFYSGDVHFITVPLDENRNETTEDKAKYFELKTGPNHTRVYDLEARKKHDEKIQKGLILFGKYYRSLWY